MASVLLSFCSSKHRVSISEASSYHTHLTSFGAFKKMITVNERKMLWEKILLSALKSTESYLEPEGMRSVYLKMRDCPWDRN